MVLKIEGRETMGSGASSRFEVAVDAAFVINDLWASPEGDLWMVGQDAHTRAVIRRCSEAIGCEVHQPPAVPPQSP